MASSPHASCYDGWVRIAKRARDPSVGKPIAGNTWVHFYEYEKRVAIRYHQTDVVSYYEDGRIVLRTGGWWTVTTRARIDEYAPSHICIPYAPREGTWYISVNGCHHDPSRLYAFDGPLTIHPGGRVTYCDGKSAPLTKACRDAAEAAALAKARAARMALKKKETAKRRRLRERERKIERARLSRGRKCANFIVRNRLLHLVVEAAKRVCTPDMLAVDRRLRSIMLDDELGCVEQLSIRPE